MLAQKCGETGSTSALQRDIATVQGGLPRDDATAAAWLRLRLAIEAHERLMELRPARREAAVTAARFQQAAASGAGMEELFFRWCGMADAMLDLLTEFLPASSPLRSRVVGGIAAGSFDDVYQQAWCDDCGGELTPAGTCTMCGVP